MRVDLTIYEIGLLVAALDELVVRAPDIVPLGDPEGLHQRAQSARSLAERLRRHPTQWAQEWANKTTLDTEARRKRMGFTVGTLYNPHRRSWPEAVQYSFRGGHHELVIFASGPSAAELAAVRKAPGELALLVEAPVILLWYRFGEALDGTAPYAWHLVAAHERTVPAEAEGRALFEVFLVDADTGILCAMRQATASPAFTAALHAAIRDQAHAPWVPQLYDSTLAALYRLPDADLARRAQNRCRLGD